MDTFTWLWLGWIAAFLGIEGRALFNKVPGDTLSEHVWRWFSVRGKGRAWQARRVGLLAFMAWLAAHFLTGGQF